MTDHRFKVTNEMQGAIIALRQADPKRWSLNNLARAFDISDTTVKRIIDPTFVDSRRRTSPAGGMVVRCKERVEADWRRLARFIPSDTRDVTGFIMGDPLPGRSALDRKSSVHSC